GPGHALGSTGTRRRLALRCDRRARDPPPRGARGARLCAPRGSCGGARISCRPPPPDRSGGAAHPCDPSPVVKVAVVAEFLPSRREPVLDFGAHRPAYVARGGG